MDCDTIDAEFPAAGGQGGRMIAENGVFNLQDGQGANIRGTSEKAVYSSKVSGNITNRQIELTGNPILETTNGVLKNKVIVLDLANRKLIAPGRFNMRGLAGIGTTNTFRLPKATP
jgi:hypothetical protein